MCATRSRINMLSYTGMDACRLWPFVQRNASRMSGHFFSLYNFTFVFFNPKYAQTDSHIPSPLPPLFFLSVSFSCTYTNTQRNTDMHTNSCRRYDLHFTQAGFYREECSKVQSKMHRSANTQTAIITSNIVTLQTLRIP